MGSYWVALLSEDLRSSPQQNTALEAPITTPKPLIVLIESSSTIICLTGPGRLLTSTAASTPGPAAPYTAISRTDRISCIKLLFAIALATRAVLGITDGPLSFRLACELPRSSVGDCPIEAQLRSRVRAPDWHARNGRLGLPGAASGAASSPRAPSSTVKPALPSARETSNLGLFVCARYQNYLRHASSPVLSGFQIRDARHDSRRRAKYLHDLCREMWLSHP